MLGANCVHLAGRGTPRPDALKAFAMTKSRKISKIGVLTSGGDAPGMNACIRAVVRTALHHGINVKGIMRGYEGLIENQFIELDSPAVRGIIQRGGTILRSARCPRFHESKWRKLAFENLQAQDIDALVVIGGDGTYTGARVLGEETGLAIVGTPGTIDNDLYGTDYTIGYDTALNTALEAIDKIRDTAASHERMFFVEVMGKDAGFIALNAGLAGGAEAILIPEKVTDIDELIAHLEQARPSQSSSIIVVAEGDDAGGAAEIASRVKERWNHYDTRVSVLGHIQRGGSPTCADRVRSSRFGVAAVKALVDGEAGVAIGIKSNEVVYTPFEKAVKHHQKMNPALLEIVQLLSAYC